MVTCTAVPQRTGTVERVTNPTFTHPGPLPADQVDARQVRTLPWCGDLPVDQVLNYALPAHGDTWTDSLTELYSWVEERTIIDTLAEELTTRRHDHTTPRFDRPVALWFTDDPEPDDHRPDLPRVGNGMHRIAATILAGTHTIWVCSCGNCDPTQHGDDHTPLVEVYARATSNLNTNDEFELLAFAARSFRLTSDVWVETDWCSTDSGLYRWLYYCPHDLADTLIQKVRTLTSARGVTLTITDVNLTTWSQLDAEDGTATTR